METFIVRIFCAPYTPYPGSKFERAYAFDSRCPVFLTRFAAEQFASHVLKTRYRCGFEIDSASWREREEWFEFQGQVTKEAPVWSDQAFWTTSTSIFRESARVADDGVSIAFFATEADAERRRFTEMKPGRYLKKYFGDGLSPKQIEYFAAWQTTGETPPYDVEADLQFARDPDSIVDVYERGPYSCMKGFKAVKVYGAGDLAIAYFEGREASRFENKVLARAICWPAKKLYGRAYPNLDAWRSDGFDSQDHAKAIRDELERQLRAQGFRSLEESGGSFDGAKLLRLPSPKGGYIMPYIDGDDRFDESSNPKYFVLDSSGPYQANNTNGLAQAPDEEEEEGDLCDACGDRVPYDDHTYDVYTRINANTLNPYRLEQWCETCMGHSSFVCDVTDHRFSDDIESVDVQYRFANGQVYTQIWSLPAAQRFAFWCDYSEAWYANANFNSVEVITDSTDGEGFEVWADVTAAQHAFFCPRDGRYYALALQSALYLNYPAAWDEDADATRYRAFIGADIPRVPCPWTADLFTAKPETVRLAA